MVKTENDETHALIIKYVLIKKLLFLKISDEKKAPLENGKENSSEGGVQLKRELGLFSAINLILAVMIGSGIFISSQSALKYSGSVGMCLVVWVTCGIISLLGMITFYLWYDALKYWAILIFQG